MKHDLTLLYVEDEQAIRENFTEIFKKYFTNILLADNGKDALKHYYNNTIDIAILDIAIPKINGLNVAKEIRDSNKKIEIIILSAYSDADKLINAINSRIFAFLVKPIERKELYTTLDNVIKKSYRNNMLSLSKKYHFDTKTEGLFFNDEKIKLSKNETKLLNYLCQNIYSYHSACEIAEAIFGVDSTSDDLCNNVVQLISRFKKKMLKLYDKKHFFIDNIYGLGYKIIN